MKKEEVIRIWMHKDFKQPMSLDAFVKKHTRPSFSKARKIHVPTMEDDLEAIRFSAQYIKEKGSDDIG